MIWLSHTYHTVVVAAQVLLSAVVESVWGTIGYPDWPPAANTWDNVTHEQYVSGFIVVESP